MFRYGVFFAAVAAAFAWDLPHTSATERARLSNLGTDVLVKTQQSRHAVDRKDRTMARQYVREALLDVKALEVKRPQAKPPFIVTLYTERISFTVAQAVKPGQRVGTASRAVSPDRSEEVREAEGQATRVSLNVTAVKADLQNAQAALRRDDFTAAASALDKADKDVTDQTVAQDLPLLKARQNLALALNDVEEKEFSKAAVPLHAAASALGEYAQSKSPHASSAAALRGQVESLADSVAQHRTGAADTIGKWWNQVSDWFTPLEPPAQ